MHKIHIIELLNDKESWFAKAHEWLPSDSAKALSPSSRLLVDSDGFAFVYILEDETGFHHIIFHQEMWSALYQALASKQPIVVELHQDVHMELTHFQEEMDFLLENIKGNGNYGEEFEQAVRAAFNVE